MTKLKFRKYDSIGASDAKEDSEYLESCFVDSGELSILEDCDTPKRIILGRTGSGKTALLQMLKKHNDTIVIPPESLSLGYITSSTVLNFFLEAGVNLNLFFKPLWRHVFSVELIKKRYRIKSESDKNNFFERLKEKLGMSKKKERAMNYLLKWEDNFWMETEYRIKEITRKVESNLQSKLTGKLPTFSSQIDGAKKLSAEEKQDVVHRGQSVVNGIQMKELVDILEYLDEDVFDDCKHKYYIAIDGLDEDWVDTKFRFLLIRSLIETQKDFRRVRNVKIITALRNDLLEKVFQNTRDAGFQEEKYRDLYLRLTWSETGLKQVIHSRLNFLFKHKYTNGTVNFNEVLPKNVEKKTETISYMIDRTLMRPREIIEFFNLCIEYSEGKTNITKRDLLKAEGEYSRRRLRSLQDEWFSLYPGLIDSAVIFLDKLPSEIAYTSFRKLDIEENTLKFLIRDTKLGPIKTIFNSYINHALSIDDLIKELLKIYFKVGLIGLKLDSYLPCSWSFEGNTLVKSDFTEDSRIFIHPTFWRSMGIQPYEKSNRNKP